MFKIPKWEDDVPNSKVDFGKATKTSKKKPSESGLPLKPINKINKTKSKNKNKPTVSQRNGNVNGNNKLNKHNQSNLHSKAKKHLKIQTNGTSTNSNNQIKFKRISNHDTGNEPSKKQKPKKRKLELENQTNVNSKTNNTSSLGANIPSKAKKRKTADDIEEGTILLKNTSKKNKNQKVVTNPENTIEASHETKADKKKEKLRQMLQQQSTRNQINVSGNKLRERMLERLKSAQFRFLNEKLYTTSGSEAQKLFQSDPGAFQTYHQGYQQQVKKWPVNPLDLIVKRISKMPKSHIVVDMGCGEAALSRRVSQQVHSFDLVAAAAGVSACDMAHTPLRAGAAHAVVYCLALMGSDLTQYLLEANRVLQTGGHLLIAEVESRFDKVETFIENVERLGFKLKNLDKSHNVFFFMEFTKIRDPPAKKSKLPTLTLKPCLYKKR